MKPALVTILRDLAHGVGIWQIWCDFCEIAAITVSNRVDLIHYDEREARYLAVVKRYTRPQLDAFARAFGTLACQLEDGIDDVLGRAFMDLELGNKWAGQFFTPFHLCRLTAELQIDDSLRTKVAERGYVTMADPAVGAGAFPLAMAAALRDAGINYQQALHVTGQDIDPKAIYMAYVQLSLCHVPAVLIVGDTLRAPGQGERWYTPAHVMGNWSGRLARKEAA